MHYIKYKEMKHHGTADFPAGYYHVTESHPQYAMPYHWHEELEIVYTLQGNSLHYIDGTCIRSQPGRLIVVNSESSHNIIPDRSVYGNGRKVVIALIISREFLEEVFPDFRNMYFLNEKEVTTPVIRELMVTLSHFGDGTELSRYEKIYRKGLVLQLL